MKTKDKTTRLSEIVKRYKVKLRAGQHIVHHLTYGWQTKLTADQFAIFEAALKSVYICNQVHNKNDGDIHQFVNYMNYMDVIFDKHNLGVAPYIDDKWDRKKEKQAHDDYHYCAYLLGQETGIDARSGEERNLYDACLD